MITQYPDKLPRLPAIFWLLTVGSDRWRTNSDRILAAGMAELSLNSTPIENYAPTNANDQ